MAIICKKCGYIRGAHEDAPPTQCPSCGAIYAKVEAHLRKLEADREHQRSGTNAPDSNRALVTSPASEQSPQTVEPSMPESTSKRPAATDIFQSKTPDAENAVASDLPSEPKQFWIAFLLNFVLAGAGHLYAGKNQVGAVLLVVNVVSWALVATGVGIVGVLGSWIYGLATTDKVIKEFNARVAQGEQIRAKQRAEDLKRQANLVEAQEVAEAFMKAHKLRSLEILTEPEFSARKAAIIGELRFKKIQGDPDDILFALVPMKQAGAISDDEITSLKKVLASI